MTVGVVHDKTDQPLPVWAQLVMRAALGEAVQNASLMESLAVPRDQALVAPNLVSDAVNQLARVGPDSKSNAKTRWIGQSLRPAGPCPHLSDGVHRAHVNALSCIILGLGAIARQLAYGQ